MVNMTFDESAPLNQAYLKEIRAEDLTRMGKFDESTKYYYEAIGSTYWLTLVYSCTCGWKCLFTF